MKNDQVQASKAPSELSAAPSPFLLLNQSTYKDDNGKEIEAATIDCLAPYVHICDGFYKWECALCKAQHQSRSCGWPISGQVLRCETCGKYNLLVRTNTTEIDKCVANQISLDRAHEDLDRDRKSFDSACLAWRSKPPNGS